MGLQTNVVRRGAVYYYRIAIPADLAPVISRREIWRSLGTSDPQLARRRAVLAGLAAHTWFEDLRKKHMSEQDDLERFQQRLASDREKREKAKQERAQVTHDLPEEQIDAFVAQYYESELAAEEMRRISERIEFDWQGKDILARDYLKSFVSAGNTDAQISAALLREGVDPADAIHYENCKEVESFLDDRLRKGDWQAAEEVVEDFLAHNPIRLSENDYRRLAHRLGHAHLEVLRLKIAWFEGRWDYKPTNPFLLKAQAALSARPALQQNKPAFASKKVVAQRSGRPPSHFVDKFLREKGDLHPKYKVELSNTIRMLEEWIGADRSIGSYEKDDIVSFKDALIELPLNYRKHFGMDTTIKAAIEANREAGRPTMGSSPTLKKRIEQVGAFFRWATDNNLIEQNPADSLRLATAKKAKKKKRTAFTLAELQAIFSSPLFVGCKSEWYWKQPGSHKIRDHRFWLPLLSLWTGCRQGELAQLLVSDIREIEGVLCVCVTDEGEGEDAHDVKKRVKNVDSIRSVPVHPELIRLGFSKYAEKMRAKHQRLFPTCERSPDGSFSPYSKHFSHLLDSLGIRGGDKVFHSFRHSFEDVMRRAKLPDSVRHRMTGRTLGHSEEQYGEGLQPETLADYMEQIRYPGLDLSHLYEA